MWNSAVQAKSFGPASCLCRSLLQNRLSFISCASASETRRCHGWRSTHFREECASYFPAQKYKAQERQTADGPPFDKWGGPVSVGNGDGEEGFSAWLKLPEHGRC